MICALILSAGALRSQEPRLTPDPARQRFDEILRQQDEEYRRKKEVQPILVPGQAESTSPFTAAEKELSFQIDEIVVEGNTRLQPLKIDAIKSKYEHNAMTTAKLDQLMKELTQAYLDGGWIAARVYLPPQNIAKKKLTLMVVEGKVQSVQINDDSWPDRLKLTMAFPVQKGDVLQLKSLEQGLDVMNRVPSGHATLKLEPGDDTGFSKVIIENKPRGAYRLQAGFDNFGQSSTGRRRYNGSIGLDNLFNLNESWSAFYTGSRDSNAMGASFTVPFEWWTYTQSASYSEYLIGLGPQTELFGSTYNLSAEVGQTVYRDSRNKMDISAGFEVKNSGRILNDTVLTPQKLTVLKVEGSHSLRLDDAQLLFNVGYHQGVPFLGADHDLPDARNDDPHQEFHAIVANFQYTQAINSWLQFRQMVQAQYAFEGLYGSEQIFMGDPFSVRGYHDSSVIGDDGFWVRNEMVGIIPEVMGDRQSDWVFTKFQPFVFTDAGYVSLKSRTHGDRLWGAGAGLRWNWDYLSAEVTYAHGISQPKGTVHNTHEIYISLSAKLF